MVKMENLVQMQNFSKSKSLSQENSKNSQGEKNRIEKRKCSQKIKNVRMRGNARKKWPHMHPVLPQKKCIWDGGRKHTFFTVAHKWLLLRSRTSLSLAPKRPNATSISEKKGHIHWIGEVRFEKKQENNTTHPPAPRNLNWQISQHEPRWNFSRRSSKNLQRASEVNQSGCISKQVDALMKKKWVQPDDCANPQYVQMKLNWIEQKISMTAITSM